MRKIKLLLFIVFMFLLCSCTLPKQKIGGDGNIMEKDYAFEDIAYQLKIVNFSMATTPATINFIEGAESRITIKTDSNIMDEITVKIKKNIITVRGQKQTVYDATVLQIEISNLLISKISLQGNYKIVSEFTHFTENFYLNVNGSLSGEIDLASVSTQLYIEINGIIDFVINNISAELLKLKSTGNITLSLDGTVKDCHITGSGDITLKAPYLKCNDIYLFLDGVVDFVVYPVKTLTVTAEGVGKIKYRGNPEITRGTKGDIDISPY